MLLLSHAHKAPRLLRVDLHWLPIERKIATISHSVVTGTAPPYLSFLLEVELYIPSRTLRPSADNRVLRIPQRCKIFKDSGTFLSLVPPSGTISVSLCDRLKLCLLSFTSPRSLRCAVLVDIDIGILKEAKPYLLLHQE